MNGERRKEFNEINPKGKEVPEISIEVFQNNKKDFKRLR